MTIKEQPLFFFWLKKNLLLMESKSREDGKWVTIREVKVSSTLLLMSFIPTLLSFTHNLFNNP